MQKIEHYPFLRFLERGRTLDKNILYLYRGIRKTIVLIEHKRGLGIFGKTLTRKKFSHAPGSQPCVIHHEKREKDCCWINISSGLLMIALNSLGLLIKWGSHVTDPLVASSKGLTIFFLFD